MFFSDINFREPNNSWSQATDLGQISAEEGFDYNVNITPGDVDYYKFEIIATGTSDNSVGIWITNDAYSGKDSYDIDLVLGELDDGELVPADGEKYWIKSMSQTETRNEEVSLEGYKPGVYYAIVYGASAFTDTSETTPDYDFSGGIEASDYAISIEGPLPMADTPSISPNGGTFIGSTQVKLTCSTAGASIRYTLDGSTPTSSSTLYSGPFTISSSCTLNAIGFKTNYTDSDVAPANFTIVSEEPSCTYSISSASQSFSSSGGSVSISVDASSSACDWTALENLSWVTLSSTSGTGDGTVTVTVSANSDSERSGTVIIAEKLFAITQEAASVCTLSISPESQSFSSSGGSVSVSVDASSSACDWTASENLSWVTLSSTSGTGDGTVTVTVSANSGSERSGTVTIAEKLFAITQEAASVCTLSISPESQSFSSSGGSVSVSVDASSSACDWTASENLSWVTLSSTSGTGDGTVTVTVSANSGSERSGTVTIAEKLFAITQEAASVCTLSISPESQSFSSSGGSVSVSVDASSSACDWTASENLSWVTLSSTSGTGDGTVTVTVSANSGSERSGTVTIAEKSFAISQVTIVNETYYLDSDGDGYGDPSDSTESESQPSGYVTDNTDCDDTDASIHPGATEIRGDGIDQDCNGSDSSLVELDFDPSFYLDKYPDLQQAFGNNYYAAFNHWTTFGIKAGRQGSSTFDVKFYLETYPDLQQAFGNNYIAATFHWFGYGIYAGRNGIDQDYNGSDSPPLIELDFDPSFYLDKYPDLQQAFGNNYYAAFNHWITFGIKAGRQGFSTFDVKFYLETYPDLQQAFGNNYIAATFHWFGYGIYAGRQGVAE